MALWPIVQFAPIVFLDPERSQDRRHRLEHHRIDVALLKPMLFGKRFGDHRPDVFSAHLIHRSVIVSRIAAIAARCHLLMIRATFSKPRLAK